ncbi:DEAD/DEAH box helicase [Pimelobacter simplex]|uniref:DEAD/DEAH box helicase n=1 Tax=Nocardioides simplex TaxID=2045 RepID=UPI00214FF7A2|nr:DEAD/DEAH box helicase [Pimelobacter simplex]UUW87788.1 DEAD/DEAH box helicase [Pimelobacter simplex]UUW97293.1 DEAD/DEAH box helicase [Pimelobacter simplex]
MNRAERQQLGAVIDEVRAWLHIAQEVRHLAGHLPISPQGDPSAELPLLVSLGQVEASGDVAAATQLAKTVWFGGRKKLQPAHEAASRLSTFHSQVKAAQSDSALTSFRERLASKAAKERKRLHAVLAELGDLRSAAADTLTDVIHMPVSRSGVLSDSEATPMQSMIQLVDLHGPHAQQLLDQGSCATGNCDRSHSSARLLVDVERESGAARTAKVIRSANARVRKQFKSEQAQVKKLAEQVGRWDLRAQSILVARSEAEKVVATRIKSALSLGVDAKLDGGAVKLVPLVAEDAVLLPSLTLLRDFSLTASDKSTLGDTRQAAARIEPRINSAFNARWECRRDGSCVALHDETPKLLEQAKAIEARLTGLEPPGVGGKPNLDLLADPSLKLVSALPAKASNVELVHAQLAARAKSGVGAVLNAAKAAKAAAADAKSAAELVHAADVARALAGMDLEVLKKATPDRVRVTALSNAGLDNVWKVYKYAESSYLEALPGLGETSAISIEQATRRLFEAVREETPVRIDVKRKNGETKKLLEALRRWHALRQFTPSRDETRLAEALAKLFKAKGTSTHVLAFTAGPTDAGPRVVSTLSYALNRSAASVGTGDVWKDFLSRPADYFGMLTELGFVTEDEKKMHGDLPEEIIEAVRAKELKRDYLTASLRTYQSFGARFALVQEKVVIGDEMGLGKTVEALAVFTHLRATGHSHFLVVCPAAVVSNWVRETAKHTKLSATRLHGPLWERNYAAKSWIRNGGVAVTTYDLLPWAQEQLNKVDVVAAVFDEAHYIKNPLAKRSIAAAAVMDSLKYVILMTGTPLENSVQEFRNLIGYIRSDLSDSAPEYLASRFRRHVAPAYLRRNQEDVLTELPEMVEIDEWMGMSDADEAAYRAAVQDGNFMLMRRAAMLSERSLKVSRLREIVGEAEANGRRVIVFSYFRDVLDEVARLLPGHVFGPLTGSIAARDRQALVDRFSQAGHGAVLVAQITAGGVGLNIQSASVVVICEPQLKPTMEAQAIARAHRMGQTNTVQVHRLLTENSVDERIREILADKKQLFDEFARDSVIAKQAPDAVDVTDAELARIVIAAERERLFGQS